MQAKASHNAVSAACMPSSPASDVSRKGNSLGTQRVPGDTSPKGEGLDAGVCAAFVFTDA